MMVNVVTTLLLIAKCSTFQHIFFSLFFYFLFFSMVSIPPHVSIYAHSSTCPSPLLFSIIFQSHFSHSCFCEFQNLKNTQLPVANKNNFQWLLHLFSSLSFLPIPFIFWHSHHLLIIASSSKLSWHITSNFVSFIQPRGNTPYHHYEWMLQISSSDYCRSIILLN